MLRILLLVWLLTLSCSVWAQKHILVLHSYDMSYAWAESEHKGIMRAFEDLPLGYDVHVEYMDTRRYKSKEYFDRFAVWLENKYKNLTFDIVLTVDDDAFNFYMAHHQTLFPKADLFFCGKGTFDETLLKTHPHKIRGAMEIIDLLDSLKIAGKLHQTKKAYYIVDASTTGNVQHELWMNAFKKGAPDFDVTSLHLANYSFEEIIEKVKTLDEGVILMNVVGQDRLGRVEDNLLVTKRIAEVSKLPIYVESSMRVGRGTMGGRVIDGTSHGEYIARKIVDFTNGKDEPPYIDYRNGSLLMFDYPAVERFGIDLEDLPAGSIVLHKPMSVFEHYGTLIWSVCVVLIILVAVITVQGIRIHNKREFQSKLQELVERRTHELNLQIEEQKKLRKTLISREKLASLGNLTAGIAHEIKNPLNIIINSAQVIESRSKQLPDQESKTMVDIRRMTQLIVKNSFRADSIIQNMLGQVRTAEAPVSEVNLNALLDEASALVFHASKTKYSMMNVKILKRLGELPDLSMAKENILRAFINLIENSFYALNEKLKHDDSFLPEIKLTTTQIGARVLVEIYDNGTGIPAIALEKILHPFFTTKPAGEGTGLGLSMVNDIVSAHGGELEIDTKEGLYTHIKMFFPLK